MDDENKPGDLITITVFCPHDCFCFHKINAALIKHKLIDTKETTNTFVIFIIITNKFIHRRRS